MPSIHDTLADPTIAGAEHAPSLMSLDGGRWAEQFGYLSCQAA